MTVMMRQYRFGRFPLADIVHERGKTRFKRWRLSCHSIDNLHRMTEGIPFRMMFQRLRLPLQSKNFGKHRPKEFRPCERFKKERWLRRSKCARKLVHDAVFRLFCKFNRAICHQLPRPIVNGKTQFRRLPRRTQRPDRIFRKMMRSCANQTMCNVISTAIRIDELHVRQTIRHAVDARIATEQILFNRDFRSEVDSKAMIPTAGFLLAPRESDF